MDTVDIHNALSRNKHCRAKVGGVLSYDQVVRNLTDEDEKIYVFNSQPSMLAGEHWMVFGIRKSEVHYFDSFGRHPKMFPELAEKMRRLFGTIYWNRQVFQNPSTTACGDYTVVFALLFARGQSIQSIVNWFASFPNTEVRDHALRTSLIGLYGTGNYVSYREDRRSLSGAHKLHIDRIARSIGKPCMF